MLHNHIQQPAFVKEIPPPPKKNLSLQYAIKFIQNRRINIQKQFKFRHRFAKKIYMTKTTFN